MSSGLVVLLIAAVVAPPTAVMIGISIAMIQRSREKLAALKALAAKKAGQ